MQGFLSHIDVNGDAEGNYTVLSRVPFLTQYGNYSMKPVGHFEIGPRNHLPVSTRRICHLSDLNLLLQQTLRVLFLVSCQLVRNLICINVLHLWN